MLKGKSLWVLLRDYFFIPLLAACIYGGWAAYANMEYTKEIALRAGLGQGLYAFFSTLLVTELAKKSFVFFGCSIPAIGLSFSFTFLLMLAIPLAVHAWLMTPDRVQAIIPGLLWGSGYIFAVLVLLYKKQDYENQRSE